MILLLLLTYALVIGPESSAAADPSCSHVPVIPLDFPDPDLIAYKGAYYAFATNSLGPGGADGANIQVARSQDLVGWSAVSGMADALPHLPAWAERGHTWAPAVASRPDGRGYVMYFTARERHRQRQCIGVATSQQPDQPFSAVAGRPLVCPLPYGAIDASTFRKGDHLYLLWKIDGNCCGGTTRLYLRELTADGLKFRSAGKVALLDHDRSWEGGVTEAPALWHAAGRYWLFYSANSWDRSAGGKPSRYATSYASSSHLRGPYRKSGKPLLGQGADGLSLDGPGGPALLRDARGVVLLAYHAWTTVGRAMFVDTIDWHLGTPRVSVRCAS